MTITTIDACDRAPVLIQRDGRTPLPGRLFWVHPQGYRAKVILTSGAIVTVPADRCELAS